MGSPSGVADLHRRLLADVLAVGARYPLALAGGDAVQAHGLFDRPSRDVEVATESPAPMTGVVAVVRSGLEQLGWLVRELATEPLSAGLLVTDPGSGEEYAVDILKETLWRPPVPTEQGLVLAVEDVVGTRVRALADRGLARDLVDVHAASDRWSHAELEELGRRHARDDFDLTELQARLAGAEWIDDGEFGVYGLDESAVIALRAWAQAWVDDIAERLQEEALPEDSVPPDSEDFDR